LEVIDLSEGAIRILRHFKDDRIEQYVYVSPAALAALFDQVDECERAEAELKSRRLVMLGLARASTDPNGIRPAALTRDGIRYAQQV
jgi:hypothetical protein